MKKSILFLLLFALVLTTYSFAQDFYGGTGTYDDPFLISTPQHLDNIRKYLGKQHADKHFLIINEIDLDVPPYNGEKGWMPIGDRAPDGTHIGFYGKLYGYMDGKCGGGIIKNLKLTGESQSGYNMFGFFEHLGEGGLLKNIGLDNYTIISETPLTGVFVGDAAPRQDNSQPCTIENCYTSGRAVCKASAIGGIAGSISSGVIMKNCYSVFDISNEHPVAENIGAIVCHFFSTDKKMITNCYSKSNIDGVNISAAGAIAAIVFRGEHGISNCVAAGSITSQSGNTGNTMHRIVGSDKSNPTLHNNWALNTTTINGQLVTGGTTTNADGQDTTLEALQSQSFYEEVLGWDFDSTWMMPETKDEQTEGFPVFQWQYNKELRVILEETSKEFDFGTVYLGDSVEQNATINNLGGLTAELSMPPFYDSNFVLVTDENIINPYSSYDYAVKFKPNELGEFVDTIQWMAMPCHVVYTVIVKGKCIVRPPSHYTITAPKDELVETTRRNYPLQFDVTADIDSPETTISRLVVRLNRHIFYPMTLDNGNMKLLYDGDTIEITITDLVVPALKSKEQTSLFTLRGDILLGEIDSTVINLSEIDFANANAVSLENGLLTTLICSEGEDRLIENSDVLPGVVVEPNPAQDVLKVTCFCAEIGDYTLLIDDVTGNSEVLHEWRVNPRQQKEYTFEFPLTKYSNGNYYIVMKSSVRSYYDKLMILK